MNSMFSLFDAFAAEQILGKFFTASTSVPPPSSFTPNHAAAAAAASSTPGKKDEPKPKCERSSMRPRFALEFDGINCFETIVPN